jgi:NADH-quinone oxidoreductase subunit E
VKHLIPEFEKLRERFPAGFESSLVLPCVRRIQEDRGYVSDSDIVELAQYLGIPQIQIEEVLSFYTMFRRKPIGRWHLQFCHNVSCSMNGAESILAHVERRHAECLGSCGTAPMMMVNQGYHENLTPATVDALLEELK